MTAGGLAALFLEQRPRLLRLLAARLGNVADAEDALQELWLRIERAGERPIADGAAYLFRMANNLATDRRVAQSRREARDRVWLDTYTEQATPSAEEAALVRDRLAQAQAVLAAMPERMREAFRLCRIEELPQREVAARMGISVSAVEKLLARGYARFHQLEEKDRADG